MSFRRSDGAEERDECAENPTDARETHCNAGFTAAAFSKNSSAFRHIAGRRRDHARMKEEMRILRSQNKCLFSWRDGSWRLPLRILARSMAGPVSTGHLEGRREMKKALVLGTKDSHLLFHASMIATATGDVAKGKEFLEKAAAVNPHYNAFHVHR